MGSRRMGEILEHGERRRAILSHASGASRGKGFAATEYKGGSTCRRAFVDVGKEMGKTLAPEMEGAHRDIESAGVDTIA